MELPRMIDAGWARTRTVGSISPLAMTIAYLAFFVSGCISYNGFSPVQSIKLKQKDDIQQIQYRVNIPFLYNIDYDVTDHRAYKLSPLQYDEKSYGGKLHAAIRTAFVRASGLGNPIESDQIPTRGLFVDIRSDFKPGNPPNPQLHSLAVFTLFIFPTWDFSEQINFDLHVYIDGIDKQDFTYQAHRQTMVWFFMLPVAWVNFFTPNLSDVFDGISKQFFEDARPILLAK
jgi:hypothetical protein